MKRFCEQCGTQRTRRQAFCTECGTQLATYRAGRHIRIKVAAFVLAVLGLTAFPTVYGEAMLALAGPAVMSAADTAGLNHAGKIKLATAHPVITADLTTACGHQSQADANYSEQGCFVPLTHTIYVLDMPSDLTDVQVVTVAHEMLHVVYAQLSADEKTRINKLLEDQAPHCPIPDLTERMAYYHRTEPGERDNELHSIFATECANLSPELEQHYAQYFDRRLQTVAANDRVLEQFASLQRQMAALDAQLDAGKKAYESYYTAHANAAHAGNAYSADYYYGLYQQSLAQYNAHISEYDTLVNRYNTLAAQYSGKQISSAGR